MIKGVNKQIVEINYTRNDYIEKAILIINPEKATVPKMILDKKAQDYMNTLLTLPQKSKPAPTMKKRALLLALSAFLTLLVLIVLFLVIS